jgi:hypothetical protein
VLNVQLSPGTPPTAVTYIGLPISSGGAHSLGRMSRRVAYHRTIDFLEACTEPVASRVYSFRVLEVPQLDPVPRLEGELQRRFGRYVDRFGDYPGIPEASVDAALDFLDEIDPQPTNRWGMAPIWFWVSSQFRILDPATGQPMPGQDPSQFSGVEYEWRVPLGSSGLRLILHNQAQIGIELCIPDADRDTLGRLIPWLQEHLPFRLSPKHWRAWTPTKSGSFKARKLAVADWL